MPKVNVTKNSKYPAQETFEKIRQYFENSTGLRKLDADLKCEFDAQKLTGDVKGSKFKAQIGVKANGTESLVDIVVELPFHLAMVKGLVVDKLQKKLDETLG